MDIQEGCSSWFFHRSGSAGEKHRSTVSQLPTYSFLFLGWFPERTRRIWQSHCMYVCHCAFRTGTASYCVYTKHLEQQGLIYWGDTSS